MGEETDYKFKVVLFGDSAVGKCELLYSLCNSQGTGDIPLNVMTKSFQIDKKVIELQIWKPSGNERFLPLCKNYRRDISGAMVVYDVTCRRSFESVRKWCRTLDREKITIMILGNKCDMTDNRKVTKGEAEEVASEIGIKIIETSAIKKINVTEAFAVLARDIVMRKEIQRFEQFMTSSKGSSNDLVEKTAQMGPKVNFSNSTFRHILRNGIEENYHIRVMFVGNEGVGNSTLVRRLLRKPVNIKKYNSTNGIDVHIHSCAVDIETGIWCFDETRGATRVAMLWRHLVGTNTNSFRRETSEESRSFHTRVAKMLQNQQTLEQIKYARDPMLVEMEADDTSEETEEETAIERSIQRATYVTRNDVPKTDVRQSSCHGPGKPLHPIDEYDIEVVITKSKALETEKKRPMAKVDFYDFAGQLVFHASHPTFLSSRAIYIMTFDMNSIINEEHERQNVEEIHVNKYAGGNQGTISDIDSIFFWLNIVYMFAASKQSIYPHVILVGTHADKLPRANQDKIVDKCFREIRCLLADSPLKTVLSDKEFVVDNTKKADPCFAELQTEIVTLARLQPHWGEHTPSKWLPLDREIQSARKSGVKVLSVEQIKELNSGLEVNISEDTELQLFLQFLHDTGEILYFNESTLRDYAVLDPVWLIDALKAIITADQFAIRSPKQADKWKHFCETGIIYQSTIVAIFKENVEDPEFFENYDHVLRLMEKFLFIVSPINVSSCLEDNGATHKEKDIEYIVPSMVQKQIDSKLITLSEGLSSTPVLCMVSKNNFLPSAVFHKLLAKCISKWQIVEQNGRKQIFCDVCKFNLDQSKHYKLTVFSAKHAIHAKIVSYTDMDRPQPAVCKQVYEFLVESLRNILTSMGFSDEFRTCIQCPKFSPITRGGYLDMEIMEIQEFVTCDECQFSHVMQTVDLVGSWANSVLDHSKDSEDKLKHQMQNQMKATETDNYAPAKPIDETTQDISDPEHPLFDVPITQDHLNHTRICNALVTVCAEGLRDILLRQIPPGYPDFYHLLLARKPAITAMRQIRQDQINIMFPDPRERYTGTVDQFDITLLYALIRNVSSVPPPVTGWGKPPVENPRDTSLGANTERIRICRNCVSGHSTDGKLDDQTF